MFDIGFWELLVVAVIALIVVGPDRLPGLVRTVGRWMGRARHYAGLLRDEFEREAARAEELKELMQMRIELEERERALAAKRPGVPVDGRPQAPPATDDPPPADEEARPSSAVASPEGRSTAVELESPSPKPALKPEEPEAVPREKAR